MTTLNCRKYEDIYKCKSHDRKINLTKLEFEKNRNKFLTVFREFEETQNGSLIKDIINHGRVLSSAYMQLYISVSETCSLYRILEIYDSFRSFYNYEPVVNNEYFIIDKCKYLATEILVLFFSQRMSNAKCELTNFHRHLWINRSKQRINDEFNYIFKRLNLIYHSLIYAEMQIHRSLVDDLDYRIDYHQCCIANGISNNDSFRTEHNYLLQRAVIVSSCATQPSYRGFTADMLRIWIALEYKPDPLPNNTIPKNCRKWTFCNESIFNVSIQINDATCNMSKRGIFLLYVNADSYELDQFHKTNSAIAMNNKFGLKMKQSPDREIKHAPEECMLPIDIQSYITVPTVLVIDSRVSSHFLQIKDQTKLAILCLLSPDLLPKNFAKHEVKTGKLFTLFLTCPIMAFVLICGHFGANAEIFKECENVYNRFFNAVESDLWRIGNENLRLFMGDSICRSLIIKYLFCNISLRLHCDFPVDGYLPKCNMLEVESKIVNDQRFQNFIYSMATILNSSDKFAFVSDLKCSINVED